jgi:hypothetical protein
MPPSENMCRDDGRVRLATANAAAAAAARPAPATRAMVCMMLPCHEMAVTATRNSLLVIH